VKTRELFGKEVIDADANRIGKVVDLDFYIQQGIIRASFSKDRVNQDV